MSDGQVVDDDSESEKSEKRTKKEKRQQKEKKTNTEAEELNPHCKKDEDSKSE